MLPGGSPFVAAQAIAAAVCMARFARGRRRRRPLSRDAPAAASTVSIVVPARDEELRIAPCLEALRGVDAELIVVDDESSDATAAIARARGARVIEGAPLPEGWTGKPWALQQGLEAASGAWVVFLDADTRPQPGLVDALIHAADAFDLLTASPRFVCTSVAERLLHPAMAATIPYRVGPLDVDGWQPRARRAMANGQCIVVRREPFVAAGGWRRVRGHLTSEDVAIARSLRATGWQLGFVDAADLLEVRMYDSARETWTGWGRSLMWPDSNTAPQQAGDIALLWLTMALPLPRLLLRRATPLDGALVAIRLGIHLALARFYSRPRGLPFALAPLVDAPVVAWLTWTALRPSRTWRGRTYDRPSGSATR